MKVWIVVDCDYEQTWPVAVFSSRRKAEEYARRARFNGSPDVVDYEMDTFKGVEDEAASDVGGVTIREAARELGVTAAWLRFGERLGYIPPARRSANNGWRRYTREDIEALRRMGVGQRKRKATKNDSCSS